MPAATNGEFALFVSCFFAGVVSVAGCVYIIDTHKMTLASEARQ